MRELLRTQLGTDTGLVIGHLLAGERPLMAVPVRLPVTALSHHLGVFGRTGCGKSNLIMVLLDGVLKHNRAVRDGAVRAEGSVFAIDPARRVPHVARVRGGADGIRGIVRGYSTRQSGTTWSPRSTT